MANANLNIRVIPFFDSVKNPLTQNGISSAFYNTGYDNLTLEISGEGSANVQVEACVNTLDAEGNQLPDNQCSWTPLSTLSAKDYAKSSAISANGIYFIGISAMSRIRINATNVSGAVTIVGLVGK